MESTYILFCGDVSSSMREPYNKDYNINKNIPKSESLFEILEKSIKILSKKKQKVFISSLLFGCEKSQTTDFLLLIDFIIDNISLLKEYINENNRDYRKDLIKLLERAGAYNISKYMYRNESPSNMECKFFYKVLHDKPYMVKEIVNELPSAAKSSIKSAIITGGTYIPIAGYYVQYKESTIIIEETRRIKQKLIEKFEKCEEFSSLNKLKEFNWYVDMPMEKTSDEIIKKVKRIYKEFPKNKGNSNIFDLFKEYIYSNTPLCNCLSKSFEFLKSKEIVSKKILIILSDGVSTDGNPLEIYNNYKNISNLYIVGAFFSTYKIQNEKTLYDNLSINDIGARQLFNLSTEVNTDSIAFDYLRDKGWCVPTSGKCRLFIQINNTDNMNDFLEFLNKLLDGTEDVLGDILGIINLKELTGKNISAFEISNQTIGNCYLHATRNIIRMARARIYPPNIPDPDALEQEIIKEFPYQFDNEGKVKGRNTLEVLKKMVPKYRLNVNQILGNNNKEIEQKVKIILLRRRPVVLSFRLTNQQWNNFSNFFGQNSPRKRDIITKEEINKNVPIGDKDGGGHAVVITKYSLDCFTVLNSWGDLWGDNGFFKIKDFSVFYQFKCFDVYFTLNDLTQYEKDEYQKLIERKKREFLED